MFKWLFPRCPLDTWEKTWTEVRMRWLADRFGIDRLLQAEVILPNEQYFPDPYNGAPEDVQRLFDRMCGYMGADPLRFKIEICDDHQVWDRMLHFERGEPSMIRVAAAQLSSPEQLLASLAHGVAHELLLSQTNLIASDEDYEWVTDLLAVFLGVGVFGANNTIAEDGGPNYGRLIKLGYLPATVFGYAFALFAFLRDEQTPEWIQHIRGGAWLAMRDSLEYLHATCDSLLRPDTIREKHHRQSLAVLADRLRTGLSSVRLASLWEICDEPAISDAEVVTAVTECLKDSDEAVAGEAARTLAAIGRASSEAVPLLVGLLHGPSVQVRCGAAEALGRLQTQPNEVVPELSNLLKDTNPDARYAAACALAQFGDQAAPAMTDLLAAFSAALVDCDYDLIDALVRSLVSVSRDLERDVLDYFADLELRSRAFAAFRDQRSTSQTQLRRAPRSGWEPRDHWRSLAWPG